MLYNPGRCSMLVVMKSEEVVAACLHILMYMRTEMPCRPEHWPAGCCSASTEVVRHIPQLSAPSEHKQLFARIQVDFAVPIGWFECLALEASMSAEQKIGQQHC